MGSLRTTQSIVSSGVGGNSGTLSGFVKSRPASGNTATITGYARTVIGANTGSHTSSDLKATATDTSTSSDDNTAATGVTQQQPQAVVPTSSSSSSSTDVVVPVSRGSSVSPSSTAATRKSGGSVASGSTTADSAYSPTPIQRPQGTPSKRSLRGSRRESRSRLLPKMVCLSDHEGSFFMIFWKIPPRPSGFCIWTPRGPPWVPKQASGFPKSIIPRYEVGS